MYINSTTLHAFEMYVNQGWKRPSFFYKELKPVVFLIKFGFYWVYWVLLGFLGDSKKNQKDLYGDSKIIFETYFNHSVMSPKARAQN